LAGPPRIARYEQKVCRRPWSAPLVTPSPARFCEAMSQDRSVE
jgi:hypothetical protein